MGTNERQAEHGKTYGWQVAVIPIAFQNAEKPRYPESISIPRQACTYTIEDWQNSRSKESPLGTRDEVSL